VGRDQQQVELKPNVEHSRYYTFLGRVRRSLSCEISIRAGISLIVGPNNAGVWHIFYGDTGSIKCSGYNGFLPKNILKSFVSF
jgi:hypothetical protein